ncbi:hypothetical protein ODS41_08870 [Pyrobaculum sp. 3827-6]|uniref:hypothetical protein n=1 Tax=Pyrobaculum sp. 3827-6 TaxID=2983604 RepID=UPI0021DA87F1|nr:hypothetical protein [Pyrobaculum sp. 3827-6]MCU7788022.1 hypothetical protein [Pyrobaculum sp. 3827-6]
MSSLEVAFLLGVILLLAVLVGWWLFSTFSAGVREFAQVYPVSAYVDSRGDFLICVLNAGPHEFYGRWVVSVKSGKSVDISLNVPVGKVAGVRGSLGESFTPGTTPALILTTGGGSSYILYPIVVPDVGVVNC